MALAPLKDLPPRYDIKGGSPKTPVPPFSQAEYQQYAMPQTEGNGVWKLAATAAVSVLVGMTIAWWSALQSKGVSQKDMQDYVREYMREYRESILQHATSSDTQIGTLRGTQEQMNLRLSKTELQQATDERDFSEFKSETKSKMGTVADYLESQKTKK